jgi:glycosyltransferase involved in cell wall biosynthesis
MRISIVNPYYDPVPETALNVTGRYRHVESLGAALAARGHAVSVIQTLGEDRTEHRGAVRFRYVRTPQLSINRLSGGPLGLGLLWRRQLRRLVRALSDERVDAVHMNGITLLAPLSVVSGWCAQNQLPLSVSHHGGGPSGVPWVRAEHRLALQRCRAAFFTTEWHAEQWTSTGVLASEKVVTCMEVSSTFTPSDRSSARKRTRMDGYPVFVWNAGLHARKDPVTALRGFSLIRRRWSQARLYMIFISNEMQPDVERLIATDPQLAESVELRGRIPPDAVEDFFNSADFIVQSSLSEFSGTSILEAMACGVIPVLSDIPSFHTMTDGMSHGILFPPGDYERLAERVLAIDLEQVPALSRQVRSYFEGALSYEVIAAIYERVLGGSWRATAGSG